MPKGVEHTKQWDEITVAELRVESLMPKGVEH